MQPKKHTQAQHRKTQILDAKHQIMQALHFKAQHYAELQYEAGIQFISFKIPYADTADRLQRSDIFWAWWLTNWAIRDEHFLQDNQAMQVLADGSLQIGNYVNSHQYALVHNPYYLSSKLDEYGLNFHNAWLQILKIINEEFIKQTKCS